MQQKIDEVHGRGVVILETYEGTVDGLSVFRCGAAHCLHRWETTASSVANGGTGCGVCNQLKYRIEELQSAVDKRHRPGVIAIEPTSAFLSDMTHFVCLKEGCGFDWWAETRYVVSSGYGCRRCSGHEQLSKEQVQERINEFHGPDRIKIVVYTGKVTEKAKFRCLVDPSHGTWSARSRQVYESSGCPTCAGKARHSHESVQEVIDRRVGKNVIRLVDYGGTTGATSEFLCLDEACGATWFIRANGVMRTSGCPACAHNGGYDQTKPGMFYVWMASCGNDNWILKFGVTNVSVESRMVGARRFGTDTTLLYASEFGDGRIAREIEKLAKSWRSDAGGDLPVPSVQEWFVDAFNLDPCDPVQRAHVDGITESFLCESRTMAIEIAERLESEARRRGLGDFDLRLVG